MANASDTAKACIDAFLKHDQEALGELLAPDLEWLENGLPHEEHLEETQAAGRGKWEGAQPELDINTVEVSGDDTTAVFEFDMSHGDASALGCAIFKVADGRVKSVHWYGHPERVVQVLWPSSATAA
jgi:ketosteroid isomerase-like protein